MWLTLHAGVTLNTSSIAASCSGDGKLNNLQVSSWLKGCPEYSDYADM